MICLADTDIVLKLAACDLLPQTLEVLGVTREDIYVVREEAYRVYRYDPDVLNDYPEVARKRALRFINSVHRISVPVDLEEQVYMEHADIDSGEQVIFGATREYQDFQVITADRKALRALAHADGCGGICNRMNGQVICLEQILFWLIRHLGFEKVQAQTSPCAAYDVAFALMSPTGKSQDRAEKDFAFRIHELQEQTRELLKL